MRELANCDRASAHPAPGLLYMWLLCWYPAEESAAEASTSFRAAELRSLAVLYGIDPARLHFATLRSSGSVRTLDVEPGREGTVDAATAPSWVAEVLEGRTVDPIMLPVYFDTDIATAVKIAQRSVLIRALLEVWGTGVGLERCVEATRQARGEGPPACSKEVATQSFRVSVAGIGCHLSLQQQREAIDALLPVSGMRGPVRMKGAECVLWYIADRWEAHALAHRRRQGKVACIDAIHGGVVAGATGQGDSAGGSASDSVSGSGADEERAVARSMDDFVLFGRELSCGSRHLLDRLALSERWYLGPTTMAPSTALLSANLAAVGAGQLVLDPCCGSGSMVLAAAAIAGAITVGSDASLGVLRGEVNRKRNKGHTPSSNFKQCGLTGLCGGWIAADLTRSSFRGAHEAGAGCAVFDSIICDPPYGLREADRGVSTGHASHGRLKTNQQDDAQDQPSLFVALLELAGSVLVDRGRLVYWQPVISDGTVGKAESAKHQSHSQKEEEVAARCGLIEVFRGEVRLSRRVRGHGKRGKGRGKAPAEQGGIDYALDREAGRERRNCIVMEKRSKGTVRTPRTAPIDDMR